jgi:prolyl-tRNA synthetase
MPFAEQVAARLGERLDPMRIKIDRREDLRPADRFFHWIQQGVPLRIEVGPKDVRKRAVIAVRRDTREKSPLKLGEVAARVPELLEQMQRELFERARTFRAANTHRVERYEEFRALIEEEGGFIEAHWNGSPEVEARIKEETKATIRLIPLDGAAEPGRCIVTGEPSPRRVLFALAY